MTHESMSAIAFQKHFWGEELPLKLMEAQGVGLHCPKIFFLKSIYSENFHRGIRKISLCSQFIYDISLSWFLPTLKGKIVLVIGKGFPARQRRFRQKNFRFSADDKRFLPAYEP
jgi:hypothetical protein